MKTSFSVAICVASLLAFSAQELSAQTRQPGAQPPSNAGPGAGPTSGGPASGGPTSGGPGFGTPRGGPVAQSPAAVVAVIDLNRVMNKYEKAQGIVEELQKAGMEADGLLRKDNALIEQLKEKLKDFKPGTQDFKRREEEITQRMSDLKVRASIEQRDFQERQMKAMYMIYQEITQEVQRYAQANGLGLVMDYSSEPVDLNVPATIQRAVSRPFVYQGGPDITDVVLNALNQKMARKPPSNTAPGGPGAAPTRR